MWKSLLTIKTPEIDHYSLSLFSVGFTSIWSALWGVLTAIGCAIPVRLFKCDLLFSIDKLTATMDESRVEMLARQHGIRQKRDDGGAKKTFAAFLKRADEGTLSRIVIEASILLAATSSNPTNVLKEAATTYKVDTDAITAKVRQEFAAKEKAKKTPQPAAKQVKKAA